MFKWYMYKYIKRVYNGAGGDQVVKTRSEINNAYAKKSYDSLRVIVPKGRKSDVEAHAKAKGQSVNGLVNALLRADMGLSEEEWKKAEEKDAQ